MHTLPDGNMHTLYDHEYIDKERSDTVRAMVSETPADPHEAEDMRSRLYTDSIGAAVSRTCIEKAGSCITRIMLLIKDVRSWYESITIWINFVMNTYPYDTPII